LEEVKEQFKLVKQHKRYEVYHIVFLIIYCIRNGIVWLSSPIHPYLSLHIHLLASATFTAYPSAKAAAAISVSSKWLARTAHL
jgi:hypothetical protein